MFLSRKGASGNFRFDEIYSALQKGLRRGDMILSLEMAKEFKNYPNALKKRLIQNCCEDCPNIYLINDIYNTEPTLNELINFIPAICLHIKCREATLGFRVACEEQHNFEPLTIDDNDLLTILTKCFTILCKNDNNATEILDFFQNLIPDIKLKRIYNFISQNRTFIYMLCAWKCIPYITNKTYEKPRVEEIYGKRFNINDFTLTKLPDFVYDKHVSSSPIKNKTYEFFIRNCVLNPRKEKTDLEIKGEELYVNSNKASGEFIKPILKCKKIDDDVKLIQAQLITSKYKPRVYFCDIDKNNEFNYVLKGPYNDIKSIRSVLLSDYIKKKLNLSSAFYDVKEYKNEYYLCCNNLIVIDSNNVEEKKSKLEKSLIYNGDLYLFDNDKLDILNSNQTIELFKILAFRKAIGTNDTCTRNIVFYDDILSSIDDPMLLKETEYIFKKPLNEKMCKKYEMLLKKNFKQIKEFINEFASFVKTDNVINVNDKSFILKQLMQLLKRDNWIFGEDY